jgi:ABC-type phosphate transport system substrate-binding protein
MFKKVWLNAARFLLAASMLGALLIPWASANAATCTFNPSDPNCLFFDGSTTVYPVTQGALYRFPVAFPGTNMAATSTGSGHGQSSIMGYVVDIGESSSNCADSNFGGNGIPGIYHCADLVDTIFARDAVTLIAQKNFVQNCIGTTTNVTLTKLEIQSIYEGLITTWGQLAAFAGHSCASTPIVPRARIVGSGTRASFLKLAVICASDADSGGACIAGGVFENTVIAATGLPRMAGNPDVESAIDANPGQIGPIGLAFTDSNNMQFCADFGSGSVCPDATTVGNLTYPMSRNLHYLSVNPSSAVAIAHGYVQKQRITDFLTWILQPDAQALARDVGYVPIGASAPDWDVNLDHTGNILDVSQIGSSWNQTAPPSGDPNDPLIKGWVRADANYDGHVNILDISTVGNHWGGSW